MQATPSEKQSAKRRFIRHSGREWTPWQIILLSEKASRGSGQQ